MWKVSNIKIELQADTEAKLQQEVAKKLGCKPQELLELKIVKKSIDARKKPEIYFNYTVHVATKRQGKPKKDVSFIEEKPYQFPIPQSKPEHPPIVVGFGPAGMMAALMLAQQGMCPIVFERGGDVSDRVSAIDEFWNHGILDPECNVQFGEGGAGTFSDGKLTARSKDEKAVRMLEELVKAGAPKEILYEAHPHIGTDRLRDVVVNIRKTILALGGKICFRSRVDALLIEDGEVRGVDVNGVAHRSCGVILAIGHSAHDTFTWLHESGIDMEAKPFAVGLRVEQFQTHIDRIQYGEHANHPALKSAEYRMVHTASNGRGVYSFCMCPGGYVVASASSEHSVVTNGMSEYARDGENANAALLVQVSPKDFGHHPLDGMRYQQALERHAFLLGGSNYKAPAQRVVDFIANKASTQFGQLCPTYSNGVLLTNLQPLFSDELNQALVEGLQGFDKQMPGFINEDAILTGVETRSSSPLRINRLNGNLFSSSVKYLYPCGEGAGYAGGIVSAGVDGIRCAAALVFALEGEIEDEKNTTRI
ncbi:MAG: NAD(P)/FAD-dependent oxidoreductase [Erysipelotrichaceae bacterium]